MTGWPMKEEQKRWKRERERERQNGAYPPSCAEFAQVSPNVVADESVMKTDEGMLMEQQYTVRHLVDLLEQCAKNLERAERYEVMGEVFKLAIHIYEQERDFRISTTVTASSSVSSLVM